MTTEFWQGIFVVVMLGSIFLTCILWFVLRLTLDRRVRKALPADKEYDAFPDMYLGFGRALIFGGFCVFNHMNNAPMYKDLYENFDVRNFANRFETFIAYAMAVSFSVFLACIPVFFITKWLGIFEWPDA